MRRVEICSGAVVFAPTEQEVRQQPFSMGSYVKGADWRHPLGRRATSTAKRNITVVQIATMMPKLMRNGRTNAATEAEFEFAHAVTGRQDIHLGGGIPS